MHIDYHPNYIIDTVDWFKIVYPSLERYQLKYITDELNINLDLAHRAIDDAVATAEVLIASINKVSVYPTDTLKDCISMPKLCATTWKNSSLKYLSNIRLKNISKITLGCIIIRNSSRLILYHLYINHLINF